MARPRRKINYASPPANAPVQSGIVKISYHEFTIEPDTAKAKVGSTVKWTNEDPKSATSRARAGHTNSPPKTSAKAESFELKLEKPGVIHYECTYLPTTMNGTIEVVS